MPFGWPDLLRSIVDGKYFLKQFLGEEERVGIFLADAPDNTAVDVHLTPENDETRQAWSQRVSVSSTLSHPHLLREIAAGETRIDGNTYSFLITDHVQERLADVVAQRTLTPDETRSVLEGALAALGHLHQQGFTHGKLTTQNIVAADDAVKVLTSSVRPLPSDELESRRAVAADLRDLSEATTQMLTGKRDPGAGAQLPQPFREFVRASFGTEECPSPTAAQLLGVLNGKPLSAPRKPVAEPVEEPETLLAPVLPFPAVPSQEPVRFKPGTITMVLAGLVVLAVAIVAYRSIAGRSPAKEETPLRTRTTDPPRAEPTRPSPVAPKPKEHPPAAASQPAGQRRWAVVAAAYRDYDAAARRAARLTPAWKGGEVTVFPDRGKAERYFVVLGLAGSQREAEKLLGRARASGMPPDTYVTRVQF